ncbi:hypothetical protein KTT_32180 [Tengunoibacter tsumagoiensis]|uniref:DUF3784 domain-containing protein n=2 Tax=Tengunoibacter tsumagoiensis TaxID=2014871 RepID=A0A402A2S7_9CHLR|nr:hypothetical protein KTT_32180 [Tengunoibacter tsumagoiensis]
MQQTLTIIITSLFIVLILFGLSTIRLKRGALKKEASGYSYTIGIAQGKGLTIGLYFLVDVIVVLFWIKIFSEVDNVLHLILPICGAVCFAFFVYTFQWRQVKKLFTETESKDKDELVPPKDSSSFKGI